MSRRASEFSTAALVFYAATYDPALTPPEIAQNAMVLEVSDDS